METAKSDAEAGTVSITRAAQILGISAHQVLALGAAGKLQIVDSPKGKNQSTATVSVLSIENFCEGLRLEFEIEHRSSRKGTGPKWNIDREFLPFPLSDTIGREEALEILYSSPVCRVQQALEQNLEGLDFDLYRLTEASPWRISRSSLVDSLARTSRKSIDGKQGA